jgi:hypothetical protein
MKNFCGHHPVVCTVYDSNHDAEGILTCKQILKSVKRPLMELLITVSFCHSVTQMKDY